MKWFAGAVLQNYSRLGRMVERTDRTVNNIALCSSGYRGVSRETADDINKIQALTDKKIRLLQIMGFAEEMVAALPYKFRQAAKFRFLRGMGMEDTAAKLGVSVRTVYRILDGLADECQKYLAAKGYDLGALSERFGMEDWLNRSMAALMREQFVKDATDKRLATDGNGVLNVPPALTKGGSVTLHSGWVTVANSRPVGHTCKCVPDPAML